MYKNCTFSWASLLTQTFDANFENLILFLDGEMKWSDDFTVVEWVEISQNNFARFFGPRMFVMS